eukprot:g8700.t1
MWDPSEDYATLWADESAFDADGFVTGPGRQPYDWDSNVESGGSFETQKDASACLRFALSHAFACFRQ